jgi:hypothetical protein
VSGFAEGDVAFVLTRDGRQALGHGVDAAVEVGIG